MKTGLSQDLKQRQLLYQITSPALEAALGEAPLTVYAGFDPTADSLHLGSLLPLTMLRRFQKAGHRVIAVIGGATGMIGDPSGKSQERTLLTPELITHNLRGIRQVIEKFLDLSGPNPARILNNADWMSGFSYIDFLRTAGKHFSVNRMLEKESVRARLEDRDQGISYTEFSYMLIQAYDFFHLHEHEGCRLQIGGSDQWGNITAGIDLIRRIKAHQNAPLEHEVYGLTHPLVTKSDGTKFGKSESGSLWLSRDKTSPYQLYQFLIQTADADVMTLLRYFTELHPEELESLEHSLKTEPEKRLAQKALAQKITELVHGPSELTRVEHASQALFSESIKELDAQTLADVFAEAPTHTSPKARLGDLPLIDALVDVGLFASKGAARKEIVAGGVYVNNVRVQDALAKVTPESLIADAFVVLRKGKRHYGVLRFE